MKFLQGKLNNPSTPLNIRLFIAKLIINTEEVLLLKCFLLCLSVDMQYTVCTVLFLFMYIFHMQIFRPYANLWLGALIQLVVSSSNGGEGIHFMVVDIVVTVLSWTSVATPKVPNMFFYHCIDYHVCRCPLYKMNESFFESCIYLYILICFSSLYLWLFRVTLGMRFWPIDCLGFWWRTVFIPNGLCFATTWRSSAQL